MDVEEGEAKMCRLCGQYEKICIDVFGEDGVRRYLGTKIHEKINILIHKDDALPQQICTSCVNKLDFVCNFYDSCHVIQERLLWLIESSKNRRQEIQPADYQTNKGDDPTQEGVTLGTEYSIEYSTIIIKEECLPDLNLDVYPSNRETQPANCQTNKEDDPMQEGVTLATEYSTEHSNLIIKEECLPDLNLVVYPSSQETKKQSASYQMNKGDNPMQSHLESKFTCPKCPNVYKSKQSLNEHLLKHESIKKSHLESKFKCPKCPKVYKSKQYLNDHLLKHEDIKKDFPCDTCGEIFHSRVRMRVHMQRHKSNSVACEICRRHLSSKEALEKHRKTVHFHDYVCDICHKKMKCKRMLRAHIIQSHLESKFKCPKCPSVYTRKQKLNEHLLSKHDIKKGHLESRFKCPKCLNVYKSKQYLNDHLLSKHKGIRKYECYICKKRFGHRSCLTSHHKVHPLPR